MAANDVPPQPDLANLFSRYLSGRIKQCATGSVTQLASPSEVETYDLGAGQPVDALAAWQAAMAALPSLTGTPVFEGWPDLVAVQEPQAAVAFCVANYPQLVRSLQPLWSTTRLRELRPTAVGRPIVSSALMSWIDDALGHDDAANRLLAVGLLRLLRQDERLTKVFRGPAPAGDYQAAWINEQAAFAWQRGRADEAAALWSSLPESTPVLFNRGMALLFDERPSQAHSLLQRAVAAIPETDPWHHLAQLYLALALMRQ